MDAAAVSTITSAVDFATVITGIGAVAASVVLVLISMKGAGYLLKMIGGGR